MRHCFPLHVQFLVVCGLIVDYVKSELDWVAVRIRPGLRAFDVMPYMGVDRRDRVPRHAIDYLSEIVR